MTLNLDSIMYPPIQLNISRVGFYFSKKNLNSHVKVNVKILIK
jgi:hypothetical protein